MHNGLKQHCMNLESSGARVGARPFLQWLRSPGSNRLTLYGASTSGIVAELL